MLFLELCGGAVFRLMCLQTAGKSCSRSTFSHVEFYFLKPPPPLNETGDPFFCSSAQTAGSSAHDQRHVVMCSQLLHHFHAAGSSRNRRPVKLLSEQEAFIVKSSH